jgi:hypothetical protein
MDQHSWLIEQFEEHRPRLRGVTCRRVPTLSFANATITRLEVIGDPARFVNSISWCASVARACCAAGVDTDAPIAPSNADNRAPPPAVSNARQPIALDVH